MYGVLLNLSLFQGWFEGCSVVSCWVYGIHQKSGMIENSGPFCGWSFGGGWLLALPHCFTRWFPINRASWSAARLVARCKRPEFSHGKIYFGTALKDVLVTMFITSTQRSQCLESNLCPTSLKIIRKAFKVQSPFYFRGTLVGGLEHGFYFSIQLGITSSQLGMSSSQLTNSYSEGWVKPPTR